MQHRTTSPATVAAFAVVSVVICTMAAGCGGGGSSPSAPTPGVTTPPPTGGGGSGGASPTATVRITASGVVPKEVTIAVGGRVTFVNESSQRPDVSSDPHPGHTDCPPVNAVDVLAPGQTRDTGAFTQARRCGYHDHDDPGNAGLRGTIVIQ